MIAAVFAFLVVGRQQIDRSIDRSTRIKGQGTIAMKKTLYLVLDLS